MTVWLNGTKIAGHGLNVSASFKLASDDISGKSSSTAKADAGDKSKSLIVRTSIKFVDAGDLTKIFELAEAKDSGGSRVIYNIINSTAQAMHVRQVGFDGELRVYEHETLQQWEVSFELSEHRSVPEKKQERKKANNVTSQKPSGNSSQTGSTSQTTSSQTQTAAQLTEFEKRVLKPANELAKKILQE